MPRPLVLFVVLLLCGLPAWGDDEPASSEQDVREAVAGWLRDLGSDAYRVREEARRHLEERGLEARDLLEAARDHDDPEVRRTVRAILAGAPQQPGITTEEARPGDLRRLGVLDVRFEAGTPFARVLGDLGRAMHGRLEAPGDLSTTEAALAFEDAPCFDVLEAVSRAAGLRQAGPFDHGGTLVLERSRPDEPRPPRDASGPLQVTVQEVSATRSLAEQAPPRYALKLRFVWAPFVQVRQYQRPKIEVARDPEGKRYRPTAAMGRSMTYGVGTISRHHETTVHVEPADEDCAPRLGALEFSLPLTLQHDLVTVALDDIQRAPITLGPDGKEAEPGTDGTITFHQVAEVEGGRGQWVVDFSATLRDEEARRNLRAALVEADGSRLRVGVYGGRSVGADGTVRITARAFRRQEGAPRGLEVGWFRREERGMLRFRLEDIPLR